MKANRKPVIEENKPVEEIETTQEEDGIEQIRFNEADYQTLSTKKEFIRSFDIE